MGHESFGFIDNGFSIGFNLMYHNFLILFFVIFNIGISQFNLGNEVEQSIKPQLTFHNTVHRGWNLREYEVQDWSNSDWVPQFHFSMTYNENDNIESDLKKVWTGYNWENGILTQFTYNDDFTLARETTRLWDNEQWHDQNERHYYYANQNLVEKIIVEWVYNDWENRFRETYAYDENGNQIEKIKQIWDDNSWENDWRYEFSYDENDKLSERLTQEWNENEWNDNVMRTYFYENDLLSSYSDFAWWDYWAPVGSGSYIYDENGYLIESSQSSEGFIRSNYFSYNEFGNLVENLEQINSWGNIENESLTTNFIYDNNLPGDVNFDDVIDVTDIIAVINFIMGTQEPTELQSTQSDMNDDSEINVIDIIHLVNYILQF